MTANGTALFDTEARANWIRLRTLILLRWFAIAGQIAALAAARWYFDLQLEFGLAFATVGASVIANILAILFYPQNKRLTEREVVPMILFDIAQLAFLIALTGGLHNPFALLILGPVTISASFLGLRSTVFLAALALVMVSIAALFNIPLRTSDGLILQMPKIFVFGFWLSIVIGTVFISIYARRVSTELHSMSEALLATQMALAREQKLTDLGGVVAAAAHELGTPLATIKLVSAEMMDELKDSPDLAQDAQLIREQADRCSSILRSMGRAGKEDRQFRQSTLGGIIREAADPHSDRGIDILYDLAPVDEGDPTQPTLLRRPEIIHGLRNLIQNAVDFATATVWIDAQWSDDRLRIAISDDGPGFPLQVIGRIGDPFVRRRSRASQSAARPDYEGMGLGLFIAKTLLERTGAELNFFNGSDPYSTPKEPPERRGAVVEVTWPRTSVEPAPEDAPHLDQNRPIQV